MSYSYPTKAADFEEGGDGYDLNTLFTVVNRGVTCTYDDLIFMPGMFLMFFIGWLSFLVVRGCYT